MDLYDQKNKKNLSGLCGAATLPYISEKFGNTISLHSFGQEAKEALEESREVVADFIFNNIHSLAKIQTPPDLKFDAFFRKKIIKLLCPMKLQLK